MAKLATAPAETDQSQLRFTVNPDCENCSKAAAIVSRLLEEGGVPEGGPLEGTYKVIRSAGRCYLVVHSSGWWRPLCSVAIPIRAQPPKGDTDE